ncbi:YheC/YheD family protein [Fervidibacillus albus]|uniref:YheC/YheD family protein n=1 Tax=Fervidibacillus albus TaxID=2980026 RepID=A0A9E8RUV1_9BACI|nr:YheC/YheD family protein [Fervidibacillus albus]WAA08731.1 YheC/YheD family protein [Fervidibacillus albus]
MPSIGLMTLDEQSEYAFHLHIAKRAVENGLDVYRFLPEAIDERKKVITGWRFFKEEKTWLSDRFSYPNFIYDRCFYRNEDEQKQFESKVKSLQHNPNTLFLTYDLPDKWTFYEIMKHNELIKPYLPDTSYAKNAKQLLKEAKEKGKILLKPAFGFAGRGIFVIEHKKDEFVVKTVKGKNTLEKSSDGKNVGRWLQALIDKRSYIVQPFLNLSDDSNRPFDLRLLLQKDGQGNWNVRGKVLRFGKGKGIISNLHAGGEPVPYDKWRERFPASKIAFIENEIHELTSTIPPLLETIFRPLVELGIDLGIDQNGAVWLLEVSGKPGRNVYFKLDRNVYASLCEAPVQYVTDVLHTANGNKEGET